MKTAVSVKLIGCEVQKLDVTPWVQANTSVSGLGEVYGARASHRLGRAGSGTDREKQGEISVMVMRHVGGGGGGRRDIHGFYWLLSPVSVPCG